MKGKTVFFLIGVEGSGHYLSARLINEATKIEIINKNKKFYEALLNYKTFNIEDTKFRDILFLNYSNPKDQFEVLKKKANKSKVILSKFKPDRSYIFHTSVPYGLKKKYSKRIYNIPNFPEIIKYFHKHKFNIKIFYLQRNFKSCIISNIRRKFDSNVLETCWNIFIADRIINYQLTKLKNYKIEKIYFDKLVNKANVSELKKLLNFSKKKYNYKKLKKNIIKRSKKNIPAKTSKIIENFIKEIF